MGVRTGLGRWAWVVPLMGTLVMVAVPLIRHTQKTRAEAAAATFVGQVQIAQRAFRVAHGDDGYASSLASLNTPCPGRTDGHLTPSAVTALIDAGYAATLRPAAGAVAGSPDCHGRPLSSDYYVAVAPRSIDAAGQQAFAAVAAGPICVFFDGIAPVEADMADGGLATRLDALDAFTIP